MHAERRTRGVDFLLLVIVCAVGYGWRLGAIGLFDPDEPFYAQTAREMLARGDWLVPHIFGHPQFEKPILYYWLTLISYAVLGVTELAGRLPPAIFGTLLVCATYAFGASAFSRRAGFLAGLVLATGVTWLVCCRMMLTDVVFAAFVSGSLFAWWRAREDPAHRRAWILVHFAGTALAVLTKGPLGTIVPLLCVPAFRWRAKEKSPLTRVDLALGLLVYASISVPWFAFMIARFGWSYFDDFFVHENYERLIRAEHPSNNTLWFYPVFLFVGALPWMPALAAALVRAVRERKSAPPVRTFLLCWFVTSLVFLTIAQSKLPTYSLFLSVPLALLVGETLDDRLRTGFAGALERWLVFALAAVQAVAIAVAPHLAPEARDPLLLPGSCIALVLLAACVSQWRAPSRVAIGLFASSTPLLIVLATSLRAAEIEKLVSVRGAVAEAQRDRRPDEPLVSDKLLVRGVAYYSGEEVRVLATEAQPFWSPHPVPILVGTEGMNEFVRTHGSAYCVMRAKEWKLANAGNETPDARYVGARIVGRVSAPAAR